MEASTLNITRPADIDGDPEDVGELVGDQLARVALDLQELAEESVVQIRSSWMSRRLGRNDEMRPERLRREWEASQAYAACQRVIGAAGTLATMAERAGSELD